MVGQRTSSARTTFHARVTHILSLDDLPGAEGPLGNILTIL